MTIQFTKVTACVLSAAGLFGCSYGQISKTKDGKFMFRTRYAPGMVLKYQTLAGQADQSGNITGPAISTPVMIKVLNNKGGHATLQITTGPGRASGSIVFAKSVIEIPMDNRNSSVGGLTPALPVKPIGTGATWKAMMPLKVMGQMPSKLDATYKFLGLKKIGGLNLAVVSFDMNGPVEGSGTMYLRTEDGSLQNTEMIMRPTQGDQKTVRLRMSVNRESGSTSAPKKGTPARTRH